MGRLLGSTKGEAVVEEIIQFEWILPESQQGTLVIAIETAGGKVEESGSAYYPTANEMSDYAAAGFEPFTMIVGAASAVFVCEALAKMWRDRGVKGGIVIDTTGPKLRIRPIPTMPNGRIVIVESDGTKVVDKQDVNAGSALLSDILAKLAKRHS